MGMTLTLQEARSTEQTEAFCHLCLLSLIGYHVHLVIIAICQVILTPGAYCNTRIPHALESFLSRRRIPLVTLHLGSMIHFALL